MSPLKPLGYLVIDFRLCSALETSLNVDACLGGVGRWRGLDGKENNHLGSQSLGTFIGPVAVFLDLEMRFRSYSIFTRKWQLVAIRAGGQRASALPFIPKNHKTTNGTLPTESLMVSDRLGSFKNNALRRQVL